jgi:hypothetical protein
MPRANAVGPDHVDIAWMSITNIHRQMGSFARLADGDTRRIPESAFHTGRGGYSDTDNPRKPDVAVVTRVLEARGGPENVRPLFTGHGQRGHAFDTATWSKLSDAPSIGSQIPLFESWRRTCRSSAAVPERMVIAKGMNRRVMRWNHRVESHGDAARNGEPFDLAISEDIPAWMRPASAQSGTKQSRVRPASPRSS